MALSPIIDLCSYGPPYEEIEKKKSCCLLALLAVILKHGQQHLRPRYGLLLPFTVLGVKPFRQKKTLLFDVISILLLCCCCQLFASEADATQVSSIVLQ